MKDVFIENYIVGGFSFYHGVFKVSAISEMFFYFSALFSKLDNLLDTGKILKIEQIKERNYGR